MVLSAVGQQRRAGGHQGGTQLKTPGSLLRPVDTSPPLPESTWPLQHDRYPFRSHSHPLHILSLRPCSRLSSSSYLPFCLLIFFLPSLFFFIPHSPFPSSPPSMFPSCFYQGTHGTGKTGKTGKMTKKNPCQGKHREFGNFAKTQGKHKEFCLLKL